MNWLDFGLGILSGVIGMCTLSALAVRIATTNPKAMRAVVHMIMSKAK